MLRFFWRLPNRTAGGPQRPAAGRVPGGRRNDGAPSRKMIFADDGAMISLCYYGGEKTTFRRQRRVFRHIQANRDELKTWEKLAHIFNM